MPFAKLTIIPALAPSVAENIAIELTELIAKDLGKKRSLTSVLIETPNLAQWSIGAENQTVAAHLEICVTAGTNSEQEKRAFVCSSMKLLRKALPTLDPATYVVVKELSATDWGFDGRTQADRAKE